MSLQSFIDQREDQDSHVRDAADDAKLRSSWALANSDPAERLIAFDRWVSKQLETRLQWTCSDDAKAKRIFQCRVELEHMLTQLFSRGWLLDGRRLANHVTTVLDAVGKSQRAGQVRDFWPYFKAAVNRYVGTNSEEIQAESRRAGNLMGSVLGAFGVSRDDSIIILVAQRRSEIVEEKTIRQQIAAKKKACKAAEPTLQFDFKAPARR